MDKSEKPKPSPTWKFPKESIITPPTNPHFSVFFQGWNSEERHGRPKDATGQAWQVTTSMIFYFKPYLGKWSNLTHIFQMGWNHQLGHSFAWIFLWYLVMMNFLDQKRSDLTKEMVWKRVQYFLVWPFKTHVYIHMLDISWNEISFG